jgi:hypothetical protein
VLALFYFFRNHFESEKKIYVSKKIFYDFF